MKRTFAVAGIAIAMLLSMPAFADANCVGNAECIGTQYNTTNQGGAGGSGYGVGVGIAGASAESNATGIGFGGNADVDVRNTNTNTAFGGQGGDGGNAAVIGSGNSHNEIDNKVTNTNINGNTNNVKNDVTNVNGQQQGQLQGQQQGQGQSQSTKNANNSSQSTNVTVQGDNVNYEARRIPVSSSYAPANFPTATCMGSTSGGAQGVGFGFSFGTSWKDENCMKLEQVRSVASVLGDKDTAAMMMCDLPLYAKVRADFCQAVKDGVAPQAAAKIPDGDANTAEPQASAKPAAYIGKPAEANAAQLY
jgi:hypothetical protein